MVTIESVPSSPTIARHEHEDPGTGDRAHSEMAGIVVAAAGGDPAAWTALTQRFGGMIMSIARSCRLNESDVAEVHQMTWLRLVENIGRIEQPDRIAAWLATTAKRESLRIVRTKGRVTFDPEGLLRRPDVTVKPPDDKPIADERAEAVHRALALLPPRCRRLLELLVDDDPPSYKRVSEVLSMPIGSIGPTRGRCLTHLRRIMADLGVED